MSEENDIELIDGYLKNQLPKAERQAFEQRLTEDEVFNSLFEDLNSIGHALQNKGRANIKNELNEIEKDLDNVKIFSKPFYLQGYFKIAASIVLLAVIGYFVFNPTGNLSDDDLFEAYYSTYPNVVQPTQRFEVELDDGDYATMGYKFYDIEEYQNAVDHFTQVESKTAGVLFYMGSSYLELGNASLAINYFEQCIDEFNELDIPGEWYLALAYLQAKEVDKSMQMLEQIKSKNNSYSPKAAELLKKL